MAEPTSGRSLSPVLRDAEHESLFPRSGDAVPVAARGSGAWITDQDGNRYLDGSGGALVVSVGHGDPLVLEALMREASRLTYSHGTQFDRAALHEYASALAPYLPLEAPRVYPVSGGSDAIEASMKLARAFHLARGEPERHVIISRWGAYHGNTRGALDVSGRPAWREPYAPWLGQAVHIPAVYEYRCELPSHPKGCGDGHARKLERAILEIGPERVAAFIAEPVGGATQGATVPPDEYWPRVRQICDRYGVLLIADEVMTGFGRTGAWFGLDHWDVRPDILAAAKGVCSGYWPMGLVCCSGRVFEAVRPAGFIHGGTFSHSGVGAAVALAVLKRILESDLVAQSSAKGSWLRGALAEALSGAPHVGDIRGLGLMIGVELVADRESKTPFSRSMRIAESVVAVARARGLVLYPSVGGGEGGVGDVLMIGPPFIVSDEDMELLVEIVGASIEAAIGERE